MDVDYEDDAVEVCDGTQQMGIAMWCSELGDLPTAYDHGWVVVQRMIPFGLRVSLVAVD